MQEEFAEKEKSMIPSFEKLNKPFDILWYTLYVMIKTYLKHFIYDNAIDLLFANLIKNLKYYSLSCKGEDINMGMDGKDVKVIDCRNNQELHGTIIYPYKHPDMDSVLYEFVKPNGLNASDMSTSPMLYCPIFNLYMGYIEKNDLVFFN